MNSYQRPSETSAFNLCGGHAALDLVNTLDDRFSPDGPKELLVDYGELLRFTEQSQVLEGRQVALLAKSISPGAAARTLRSVRELREALAAVLYAGVDGGPPSPAAIRILERRFHDASRHRELRWERSAAGLHGHPGMKWQWGRFAKEAELPLWMLAHAASQLTLSNALEQVRACGADNCRWLFLDTSKNHTRRWCDMKVCGNRMKARRFQARHA